MAEVKPLPSRQPPLSMKKQVVATADEVEFTNFTES